MVLASSQAKTLESEEDTLQIHSGFTLRTSLRRCLFQSSGQHSILFYSCLGIKAVLGLPPFLTTGGPQTVTMTFHKSSWTFWPYNSHITICREQTATPSHTLCLPTAHWLPKTLLSSQAPAIFPYKRLQENWKCPTKVLFKQKLSVPTQ